MPQLNPADFMPQLFWLAVTFITLYLIMARLSLPRIAALREERAKRIADDLENAERLKAEADQAEVANAAALSEARARAIELGSRTREELKSRTEARQKDVADRLAAEIEAAESRINTAKNEAIAEVRDVAADVCAEIVAKLTGLRLDQGAVRAAVDAKLHAGQKEAANV